MNNPKQWTVGQVPVKYSDGRQARMSKVGKEKPLGHCVAQVFNIVIDAVFKNAKTVKTQVYWFGRPNSGAQKTVFKFSFFK